VLTDGDGQGSETWEELISEWVFGQEIPLRWVLAVSRDQLLLIDRQKWAAVCVCGSGMYWPISSSTLTPPGSLDHKAVLAVASRQADSDTGYPALQGLIIHGP
jgi:hypothetical protein